MEQGLIHIYHGDGKGKTTCAFGLALRCAGCGEKVVILQLLKGGETGEVEALSRFSNVELVRGNPAEKFTFQMNEAELAAVRAEHDRNFAEAVRLAQDARMLVIDELMAAWNKELIDRAAVLDFLDHKPERLEVVLTGRNPPQELLCRADYITEMKKQRHPFDCGICARRGIEL